MALGAGRSRLARFVLERGARPVVIGLVVGVAAGVRLARVIESQVFTIRLTDPLAIVIAVGLLTLAASAACWVPARRAMRVDPVVSLRAD